MLDPSYAGSAIAFLNGFRKTGSTALSPKCAIALQISRDFQELNYPNIYIGVRAGLLLFVPRSLFKCLWL